MSRRRARRGPPTCHDCHQVITWFHTPNITGRAVTWRKFDPHPVDIRTHTGAPAHPVENNRVVWRFRELVEDLMVRREISQHAAQEEAYDMPWYVPHTCPQNAHQPASGRHDDEGNPS